MTHLARLVKLGSAGSSLKDTETIPAPKIPTIPVRTRSGNHDEVVSRVLFLANLKKMPRDGLTEGGRGFATNPTFIIKGPRGFVGMMVLDMLFDGSRTFTMGKGRETFMAYSARPGPLVSGNKISSFRNRRSLTRGIKMLGDFRVSMPVMVNNGSTFIPKLAEILITTNRALPNRKRTRRGRRIAAEATGCFLRRRLLTPTLDGAMVGRTEKESPNLWVLWGWPGPTLDAGRLRISATAVCTV